MHPTSLVTACRSQTAVALAFANNDEVNEQTFIHPMAAQCCCTRYASETRRTNKRIESRLRGFEGRWLRRLLKIRWERRVVSVERANSTNINHMVSEVKRRRRGFRDMLSARVG